MIRREPRSSSGTSNWSGTSRARPEIGVKRRFISSRNDGRSWCSGLSPFGFWNTEATTNA